jgi:hypothetical protein
MLRSLGPGEGRRGASSGTTVKVAAVLPIEQKRDMNKRGTGQIRGKVKENEIGVTSADARLRVRRQAKVFTSRGTNRSVVTRESFGETRRQRARAPAEKLQGNAKYQAGRSEERPGQEGS